MPNKCDICKYKINYNDCVLGDKCNNYSHFKPAKCVDCGKEITGKLKTKLWHGEMLNVCYDCWVKIING